MDAERGTYVEQPQEDSGQYTSSLFWFKVYDYFASSKGSKIKSVVGKPSHCKTQGGKFELFSSFYQQKGMVLNAG